MIVKSSDFVVSHLPIIGFVSTVVFSNSWCQDATSLMFRHGRSSVWATGMLLFVVAFVVARKKLEGVCEDVHTYVRDLMKSTESSAIDCSVVRD